MKLTSDAFEERRFLVFDPLHQIASVAVLTTLSVLVRPHPRHRTRPSFVNRAKQDLLERSFIDITLRKARWATQLRAR